MSRFTGPLAIGFSDDGTATLLEHRARRRVDQSEDDEAGVLRDLLEDALKMRFGADHRPEVADRLDIVILGERRLGDVLQRLAGRIRQQMEVQPHQRDEIVDNMGASGSATARGRQASAGRWIKS